MQTLHLKLVQVKRSTTQAMMIDTVHKLGVCVCVCVCVCVHALDPHSLMMSFFTNCRV